MQGTVTAVTEEDAVLVRQTLGGDAGAFTVLVTRYRSLVSGIAYHYLSRYEDAQDVAQEAFVQAFLRLPDLREPAKFAPWLRRATMNLCADRLRKRGLQYLSLESLPEEARPCSEGESETIANRMLVRQALSRLSPPARLTVTLHYLGGYSQEEVAQMLEIPLNTVRSRLQSAKRKLREEMNLMETTNKDQSGNVLLPSDPPNREFARQVVAEAMRRGAEALEAYRKQDAVLEFEQALQTLAQWPPDEEQRQLKMQALWQKGRAITPYQSGSEQAIPLFEQALEIARELGDKASEAEKLQQLASVYFNTNHAKYAPKIVPAVEAAESLFAELGDLRRQGQCRRFLGDIRLQDNVARGRQDFEAALKLFEQADAPPDAAFCRAFLTLLNEVGEAQFSHGLIGRYSGVDGLKAQNGWIAHVIENNRIDWTWGTLDEKPLRLQRVFWQVGQLHPFFDANIQVGASWTKPADSYSQQPLTITATVLSDEETITVPAGTFAHCRLIEYVTIETDLPDAAPPDVKAGNRRELCGTRRAWYAPNVGIAQLHIQSALGDETTMQLHEYRIGTPDEENSAGENSSVYLPLAIGSHWAYGWAGLISEITAREVYTVTAQTNADSEPGIWCLEHYAYAFRKST